MKIFKVVADKHPEWCIECPLHGYVDNNGIWYRHYGAIGGTVIYWAKMPEPPEV